MKIYLTKKGNFCTFHGRFVGVRAKKFKAIVQTVQDVSAMLGVSAARVKTAANAGSTILSVHCDMVFHLFWPEEDDLRARYPDAIFINSPSPHPPRPCTVHYHLAAPHPKSEDVDFRTMTDVRDFLKLTRRQFVAISQRAPGYRSHLPFAVIGITVHPPGWLPASGVFFQPTTNPGALWRMTTLKNGDYRTRPLHRQPQDYKSLRDVPDAIMNNCV